VHIMAKIEGVFKRYEKKYLLDRRQYQELSKSLTGRMLPDRYGQYTICNIYFDTEDYRLIRASLEKPVYKEKLRLRSYGTPTGDDTVFIELKKKFKGVVYKRRVPIKMKEASAYLLAGKKPEASCQILKEIDWFISYYRPAPKVYIAYDRMAFHGQEDETLRITFDSGIRFREDFLELEKGDWGDLLMDPGQILMEIKTGKSIPLWLSRLLSELNIYPASYSKYGNCYKSHLLKAAAFKHVGSFKSRECFSEQRTRPVIELISRIIGHSNSLQAE
jgi:hypothetical protein